MSKKSTMGGGRLIRSTAAVSREVLVEHVFDKVSNSPPPAEDRFPLYRTPGHLAKI